MDIKFYNIIFRKRGGRIILGLTNFARAMITWTHFCSGTWWQTSRGTSWHSWRGTCTLTGRHTYTRTAYDLDLRYYCYLIIASCDTNLWLKGRYEANTERAREKMSYRKRFKLAKERERKREGEKRERERVTLTQITFKSLKSTKNLLSKGTVILTNV